LSGWIKKDGVRIPRVSSLLLAPTCSVQAFVQWSLSRVAPSLASMLGNSSVKKRQRSERRKFSLCAGMQGFTVIYPDSVYDEACRSYLNNVDFWCIKPWFREGRRSAPEVEEEYHKFVVDAFHAGNVRCFLPFLSSYLTITILSLRVS
jgi:hypothetical protein